MACRDARKRGGSSGSARHSPADTPAPPAGRRNPPARSFPEPLNGTYDEQKRYMIETCCQPPIRHGRPLAVPSESRSTWVIVRYSGWEVKVWYNPKTRHTISCGKLVRAGCQGFAAPMHNGWEERPGPAKVADSPPLIKAPAARGVVHGLWTACGRREVSGVSRFEASAKRHPAMHPLHECVAGIASARNAPCPHGRLHE